MPTCFAISRVLNPSKPSLAMALNAASTMSLRRSSGLSRVRVWLALFAVAFFIGRRSVLVCRTSSIAEHQGARKAPQIRRRHGR